MLRLRPYKACDAETIVKWIGDETAFRKWCADRYESYPITAEDINRHYDAMAFADNFYQMTAYDETGVVGHLIMRFTDENKTAVRLGFIIVDSQKRGQHLGRRMIALAEKYAFEFLGAEKMTLGVFENNLPAYKCYKASGFRDVPMDKDEYYEVLGEKWKCLELELTPADL